MSRNYSPDGDDVYSLFGNDDITYLSNECAVHIQSIYPPHCLSMCDISQDQLYDMMYDMMYYMMYYVMYYMMYYMMYDVMYDMMYDVCYCCVSAY